MLLQQKGETDGVSLFMLRILIEMAAFSMENSTKHAAISIEICSNSWFFNRVRLDNRQFSMEKHHLRTDYIIIFQGKNLHFHVKNLHFHGKNLRFPIDESSFLIKSDQAEEPLPSVSPQGNFYTKRIILNAKFIILNAKFIILNTQMHHCCYKIPRRNLIFGGFVS